MKIDYAGESWDRFQELLNNCNVDFNLSDEVLDQAWSDFVVYEDDEGCIMNQDMFNERLKILQSV